MALFTVAVAALIKLHKYSHKAAKRTARIRSGINFSVTSLCAHIKQSSSSISSLSLSSSWSPCFVLLHRSTDHPLVHRSCLSAFSLLLLLLVLTFVCVVVAAKCLALRRSNCWIMWCSSLFIRISSRRNRNDRWFILSTHICASVYARCVWHYPIRPFNKELECEMRNAISKSAPIIRFLFRSFYLRLVEFSAPMQWLCCYALELDSASNANASSLPPILSLSCFECITPTGITHWSPFKRLSDKLNAHRKRIIVDGAQTTKTSVRTTDSRLRFVYWSRIYLFLFASFNCSNGEWERNWLSGGGWQVEKWFLNFRLVFVSQFICNVLVVLGSPLYAFHNNACCMCRVCCVGFR